MTEMVLLFSVCCMAFSSHFQVLSDENGVTCALLAPDCLINNVFD